MTHVYKPIVSSQIYGLHVPYDQGYDAHSQRNYPKAENNKPSGFFKRADGSTIAVWITDVIADFSLAGQSGQSRMQREFYPRSFNDVTLRITGNVASTQEYNRLALFVREHQWKALNYINQGGVNVDQTITFALHNNTPKAVTNTRQPIIKGSHKPWRVQGYIKTIAAGAVAHNIAPQFDISFIVCDTTSSGNTSIWSEMLEMPARLQTFLGFVNNDITNHTVFGGFVPTWDAQSKSKSNSTQKTVGKVIGSTLKNWSTQAAFNPFGL